VRINISALPRVGVILASNNGMDFIAAQIDSILGQTDVEVHIFLSVDKSSDGTEQWCEGLASRESRVTLLETGFFFGGASANFFRLLREVCFDDFDYIAYSDQDDMWNSQKLARAHQKISLTGADAYSSDVTAFWASSDRTKLIKKSQPQRTYVMCVGLAKALQCAVTARAGALTGLTFHDWFSYAFARSCGYTWYIDDYSSLVYRQHEANQFGANSGLRPFLRRVKDVWSGRAFEQLRLMVQVINLPSAHPVQVFLSKGGWGLLQLALHSRRCRRKGGDQLLFFASCIIGAVRSVV
jgi:rhamnosyltransferase